MTIEGARLVLLRCAVCVLIVTAACGDTTTPKPAIRTNLSAASSTKLTATVGSNVDEAPSVVVRDSTGRPVAGVLVTFSVTDGGGVIEPRAAVSGANGVVTLDRWTLGTVPGRNALVARNPSGNEVEFVADAVVGAPAAIQKTLGDGQSGEAGAALLIRPRVSVRDAWDNPVPGVAVTFTVEVGGGSVSAASSLTDFTGVAESGPWVLGAAGAQRLVASVGSLVAEPFTARVIIPLSPCVESGPLEAATRAQLSTLGCNAYTILVPTTATYSFAATSSEFDTNLQLRDADRRELAGNDDSGVGTTNSAFVSVLPPGKYTLYVSTTKPGAGGSFDLSLYNPTGPAVGGCAEAFVVRGVTIRGTTYTGCAPEAFNPADRYRIYFEAGDPINIQVLDFSYSGPMIRMVMPNGRILEATSGANYLTTIFDSAPVSGYYQVIVGLVFETGLQYELRIR